MWFTAILRIPTRFPALGVELPRYVRRALRLLAVGLLLLLSAAAAALGAWAALFSCYSLCLVLAGLSLSVLLVAFPVERRPWLGPGLLGLLVCFAGATWRVPVREVDRSIESLARRAQSPAGTSSLSLRDKLGIYGLNVAMGLAALPLYPEAARETLLLAVPPDPTSGRRVFRSSFAMRSTRVREVVESFKAQLRSAKGTTAALEPVRVSWPSTAYRQLGGSEARVALALNPSDVSAVARRSGRGWELEVRVEVRVEYPKRASVLLIESPRLRVEEGLFWALQQAGWLHPYTAVWEFQETVPVDADQGQRRSGGSRPFQP